MGGASSLAQDKALSKDAGSYPTQDRPPGPIRTWRGGSVVQGRGLALSWAWGPARGRGLSPGASALAEPVEKPLQAGTLPMCFIVAFKTF